MERLFRLTTRNFWQRTGEQRKHEADTLRCLDNLRAAIDTLAQAVTNILPLTGTQNQALGRIWNFESKITNVVASRRSSRYLEGRGNGMQKAYSRQRDTVLRRNRDHSDAALYGGQSKSEGKHGDFNHDGSEERGILSFVGQPTGEKLAAVAAQASPISQHSKPSGGADMETSADWERAHQSRSNPGLRIDNRSDSEHFAQRRASTGAKHLHYVDDFVGRVSEDTRRKVWASKLLSRLGRTPATATVGVKCSQIAVSGLQAAKKARGNDMPRAGLVGVEDPAATLDPESRRRDRSEFISGLLERAQPPSAPPSGRNGSDYTISGATRRRESSRGHEAGFEALELVLARSGQGQMETMKPEGTGMLPSPRRGPNALHGQAPPPTGWDGRGRDSEDRPWRGTRGVVLSVGESARMSANSVSPRLTHSAHELRLTHSGESAPDPQRPCFLWRRYRGAGFDSILEPFPTLTLKFGCPSGLIMLYRSGFTPALLPAGPLPGQSDRPPRARGKDPGRRPAAPGRLEAVPQREHALRRQRPRLPAEIAPLRGDGRRLCGGTAACRTGGGGARLLSGSAAAVCGGLKPLLSLRPGAR